jgi:hypothetical protein
MVEISRYVPPIGDFWPLEGAAPSAPAQNEPKEKTVGRSGHGYSGMSFTRSRFFRSFFTRYIMASATWSAASTVAGAR